MGTVTSRKIWIAVKICVVSISAVSLLLPFFSIYPIYTFMELAPLVVLYPASIIFCGYYIMGFVNNLVKSLVLKTGLKWLVRLIQAALIIVCLGVACLNMLLSSSKRIYSCPYDSRKLVVLESFWLDPTYTAYPTRFGFFYQKQDNGSVTTHDAAGRVQVYWDSAVQAKVHIKPQLIYGEFSNPNGEIIVTYK